VCDELLTMSEAAAILEDDREAGLRVDQATEHRTNGTSVSSFQHSRKGNTNPQKRT
jgi:hypothetical protein